MSISKFPTYKIHMLVLQAVIFFAFIVIYINVISPVYYYSGFMMEFSTDILIISISLFLILMSLGLFIKSEFIYACWQILFLFIFPGTAVFHIFNDYTIMPLLAVSLFLMIFAFSDIISFRIKGISLNIEEKDNNLYAFWILVLIMIIPFLFYLPHINLRNLFFVDIYETRLAFRDIQNQVSGYLFSPLSKVALPALIVISIRRKNWLMLFLSIFLLIYMFLCGAQKGVFIGMIAVLLFYYGGYKFKPLFFGYIVIAICFAGLLFFYIGNNFFQLEQAQSATILGIFIRRVFFLPAMLDTVYYEYFMDGYLYYSQSFPVSLLIEYPYDKHLTMYMGEDVLGHPNMSANVGLITESYISLGFVGVLFISLVLSLIFAFLKGLNISPVYFGIVIIYLFQMNSSFLSVLLVTHGMFFMLMFFWLFLRVKQKEGVKKKT